MNGFRERQPELFIIRLVCFGVPAVGVLAGIDHYILRPLKGIQAEIGGLSYCIVIPALLFGVIMALCFLGAVIRGLIETGEAEALYDSKPKPYIKVETENALLSMCGNLQSPQYGEPVQYIVNIDASKWDVADRMNVDWLKKHPSANVRIEKLVK